MKKEIRTMDKRVLAIIFFKLTSQATISSSSVISVISKSSDHPFHSVHKVDEDVVQ